MAKQQTRKINWLERHLPEGLLVDSAWLTRQGYSTSLRSQYLSAGWLEQPARRVYRRPRGTLTWQQVVISLQTLLEYALSVGGRTALELQGQVHYVSRTVGEVHLYGPKPPPTWLRDLRAGVHFRYHNDRRLFAYRASWARTDKLNGQPSAQNDPQIRDIGLTVQPWGQWDWPLVLSTAERATLELLDELPERESFHQTDKQFEGLTNLSPRRLQKLLTDCRSVKVKRLFFFFADRHKHQWLAHLDRQAVDLGSGKRLLVKGGRYDAAHQITVPEDLDAV